jgi:hypothetical protein
VSFEPLDKPVGVVAVQHQPVRNDHVLKQRADQHGGLDPETLRDKIVRCRKRLARPHERGRHDQVERRFERKEVALGEAYECLAGPKRRRDLALGLIVRGHLSNPGSASGHASKTEGRSQS